MSLKPVLRGAFAAGVFLSGCARAEAACQLKQFAELPVVSTQGDIVVDAKINGRPTEVLLDTGSVVTALWRDKAVELGLKLGNIVGVNIYGVGGRSPVQTADIGALSFGTSTVRDRRFLVLEGGDNPASKISTVLGIDFFVQSDVEFDLPDHTVRMIQEQGCAGPDTVYWNKPYSQVGYRGGEPGSPSIYVTILLNGQPVEAQLDTGSSATVIDESLAARLGGVPDKSAAGTASGIGFKPLAVSTVSFASFTLGDETIKNVKIQSAPLFNAVHIQTAGTHLGANLSADLPRILLGADFLRAHRLLISRPHHMAYFSYMGGPVFDVMRATRVRQPAGDAATNGAKAPPHGG